MTEYWIFALCACYTWNLIKLYGMMKLGLVCLFLFCFCFKQSSQGLLWLSNPLFPSKGCWELPVIYKTGMTVSLGEMISNSINISNQVLVLKFYEVIEIVGMFLQEAGQWGARQLTWVAVLLALGLKPGCSLERVWDYGCCILRGHILACGSKYVSEQENGKPGFCFQPSHWPACWPGASSLILALSYPVQLFRKGSLVGYSSHW